MLDLLLRAWLGQAAKRHVYQAASKAAFEHLQGAAEENSAPSDEPRRESPPPVGLIFTQAGQAGSWEDRLSGVVATDAKGLKFVSGGVGGRAVVHVVAEATFAAVQAAAEALIAGHKPTWVIAAGCAQPLQESTARGDFFMATEIVNEAGQSLAIDLQLPPAEGGRARRVHDGKLLSIDRSLPAAQREALARSHEARAVDRESFAVAEVCRREKTRFLSVRLLSDVAAGSPPRAGKRASPQKSAASRWGATFGAVLQRPGSLKEMFEVQQQALEDADRLAKFLQGIVAQLTKEAPPPEGGAA